MVKVFQLYSKSAFNMKNSSVVWRAGCNFF